MTDEFNKMYDKLYKENFQELEKYRKYVKKHSIKLILLIVLIFICFTIPLGAFLGFSMIVIFIIWNTNKIKNNKQNPNKSQEYNTMFKNQIIKPLVESINEQTVYQPEKGIDRQIYYMGSFENTYNKYMFEDQINILLSDGGNGEPNYLTLSEVETTQEHIDSDGNRSSITLFHGIVGYVDIGKESNSYIKVKKNGSVGRWNKNKVNMDMSEFEKYFDVESDNKIEAMQILTADIMTMLIDFLITSKIKFDFHIIGKKLYIRFKTGPVFEPNIFRSSMEKELIWRYYNISKFCMQLSTNMCRVINESHI